MMQDCLATRHPGESLASFGGGSGDEPSGVATGQRVLIEQTVAQVFGVAHCDLKLTTRGRANVALARQVAMYLAHVTCHLSLTEVGDLFNRDRTTVAHACGLVEDRRDDLTFDRVLELLEWIIDARLPANHRAFMLPS